MSANAVPNESQGWYVWVELPEDMSCYEGPAPRLDNEACSYIPAYSTKTQDPTGCLLTDLGAYDTCAECEDDW